MGHPNEDSSMDLTHGSDAANKKERLSVAQVIINGLGGEVRFVKSIEGDAYIAFRHTPHRALRVDGSRSDGMRAIAMKAFAETQRFPTTDALKQVENYIYAECMDTSPVPVYLRAAHCAGTVYLDTGNAENEVIEISPQAYRVKDTCPVLFRRSDHTAAWPDIQNAQPDLNRLRRYVRLDDAHFAALVGCIIGTMLSDIPQPIIAILGSAKAGKTTAMQYIVDLIDPTTDMPGGTLTNDPRTMKSLASIRRPLIFDNVSRIDESESDLLARIATGGEIIGRRLYSNDDAHVTQVKRPIIINGIMEGFARSDLASRTFAFELPDFAAHERVASSSLAADWERDLPMILAGLCGLAVAVVAARAQTSAKDYVVHRNNDVMQIIDVVSGVMGADGLGAVTSGVKAMAQAVLASSYVAHCIIAFADDDAEDPATRPYVPGGRPKFLGAVHTAPNLLAMLKAHQPFREKDLPRSPKGLGEALMRIAPDLASVAGITMVKTRSSAGMLYRFERVTSE